MHSLVYRYLACKKHSDDYINKIKLTDYVDYANLYYNKGGNLFLIQYIHLERIDENCFLGTVAYDKY